jgi:hypothetical protein
VTRVHSLQEEAQVDLRRRRRKLSLRLLLNKQAKEEKIKANHNNHALPLLII